jgi:hypothetical protein
MATIRADQWTLAERLTVRPQASHPARTKERAELALTPCPDKFLQCGGFVRLRLFSAASQGVARNPSSRPGGLKIEAAGDAVNVEQFSGKI